MFSNHVLELPEFTFSESSDFSFAISAESGGHHYVPHFSIDLVFKRAWSVSKYNKLCELITDNFGYIPFGGNTKKREMVSVGFHIRQWVDPDFITKLASALRDSGYISAEDEKNLREHFATHQHLLRAYYDAQENCHQVTADYVKVHDAIEKEASVTDIEKLLCDKAIDVNAQDAYGYTALSRAVIARRLDVVKLLLAHGANPNTVDWFGGSPLESASYIKQFEMVKALLEHGADPNLFWDNSPMHNAFHHFSSDEIAGLLAQYGARLDLKNKFDQTPDDDYVLNRDDKGALRRRIQVVKQNYRPAKAISPLFTAPMGHIDLDHAQRYYLFPMTGLFESSELPKNRLIKCLRMLIENNLDFSLLPSGDSKALEGLKDYINYKKDRKCSNREHNAWIRAGLLESLFLIEKEANLKVDLDWYERNRIDIRNQIVHSLPLPAAQVLAFQNEKKKDKWSVKNMVKAKNALMLKIVEVVGADWQQHTRVGERPLQIQSMLEDCNMQQAELADWIAQCKKKNVVDSNVFSFFHRYVRGRDAVTANFYQAVAEIDMESIDSMNLAKARISSIMDILRQSAPVKSFN